MTTLECDCSKFDVESKPRFAEYIFDELDIFFDFESFASLQNAFCDFLRGSQRLH